MSENHQAEQQLALTFTTNEWAVIRAGLYELPAKLSVAVLGKLERQLQEQLQPKTPAIVS